MASDMLQQVIDAENEAAKKESASSERAKTIIEDAKQKADEISAEAKQKNNENRKARLDEADAKAKEHASAAAKDTVSEIERLKTSAQSKREKAVEKVRTFLG